MIHTLNAIISTRVIISTTVSQIMTKNIVAIPSTNNANSQRYVTLILLRSKHGVVNAGL